MGNDRETEKLLFPNGQKEYWNSNPVVGHY